jgi:hypothetical protein
MALVERAPFVFLPGTSMSWGLIGDAWRRGTPVIAQAEHYDLCADQNCLITCDAVRLVEAVSALESDEAGRNRIIQGGLECGLKHSPAAVASALRTLCLNVVAG